MGKEEKPWEKQPELEVCLTEVCASYYFRTDVTLDDGNVFHGDQTTLAGSWEKWCTGRSDNFTTYLFGEDVSDGCKEVKKYIKVCTINA